MVNFPSIFNDVIGPVMRGPSSSHSAAALRIGRFCRDLMDGDISHIVIDFDPDGSLVNTHRGQGSDFGLFGGILGWEADDPRLPHSEQFLEQLGITVEFRTRKLEVDHLNTYHITLRNIKETKSLTAISTGGGMIEVVDIDGVKVSMFGDFFETLIYYKDAKKLNDLIEKMIPYDYLDTHLGVNGFIEIKSQSFPDEESLKQLWATGDILSVKKLSPVLPVLSRKNPEVPFSTCNEMLEYNKDKNLSIYELAVFYETERGNLSEQEVLDKMLKIVKVLRESIKQGLNGTDYNDRLLDSQSVEFKRSLESNKLIHAGVLNNIIMFVSALMEVKSSMGVIVAAPTAGSCGALPGAVLGVADMLRIPDEVVVEAFLVAGLIGIFIANQATFAGEIAGCGVEYGSGGSMAAAGIVYMAGGSILQSLSASSLLLQSMLGMTCTPIANRVEAPCLGNNILAATNSVTFANMALADYDALIPLDEVIETMYTMGKGIPHEFKCTNIGGLCATKTARILEAKLNSYS